MYCLKNHWKQSKINQGWGRILTNRLLRLRCEWIEILYIYNLLILSSNMSYIFTNWRYLHNFIRIAMRSEVFIMWKYNLWGENHRYPNRTISEIKYWGVRSIRYLQYLILLTFQVFYHPLFLVDSFKRSWRHYLFFTEQPLG